MKTNFIKVPLVVIGSLALTLHFHLGMLFFVGLYCCMVAIVWE